MIADCRHRLAETERSLQRRPLRPGTPRDLLDRWGERLRQRWQQAG